MCGTREENSRLGVESWLPDSRSGFGEKLGRGDGDGLWWWGK